VNPVVRLGAAKVTGFVVGLVGFFLIPVVWPAAGPWFRWGVLLWYGTFGVAIGLLGFFDRHPWLGFPMPFWFRGIVFGAWLNLVFTLVAHEKLAALMAGHAGIFADPFWMVAEGAVLGVVIDAVATRLGGEGPVRG
jgi:hypothetical protein